MIPVVIGIYLMTVCAVLFVIFIAGKRKELAVLVDQFTGNLEQAAVDREFADWAERTCLIVTTRDGMMFTGSIRDLERTGLDNHTWTDPICVSLLNAPLGGSRVVDTDTAREHRG